MADVHNAKVVTVPLQALKQAFLAYTRGRMNPPLSSTEERLEWDAFWHRLGGAASLGPTPAIAPKPRGAGW